MLFFGVNIPATVPQRSEIPEGLTNYPVYQVIRSRLERDLLNQAGILSRDILLLSSSKLVSETAICFLAKFSQSVGHRVSDIWTPVNNDFDRMWKQALLA